MLNLPKVTAICVDGTPDGSKCDIHLRIISALKKHIKFNSFKFAVNKNIKSDLVEIIKIPKITDSYEYSKFILLDLPDMIDSEFCMIIHADGFPINFNLWDENFIKYDYIGAPWGMGVNGSGVYPHHYHRGLVEGGNGGFSIRSKKLMKLIREIPDNFLHLGKSIRERCRDKSLHEDGFICYELRSWLKQNGCAFAPYDLAKKFSLETSLEDGPNDIEKVFGFHGYQYGYITMDEALRRIEMNN